MAEGVTAAARAASLTADCGSCVGLCCVGLAFGRSAEFAFDKPAGDPCPNLQDDYRCGIHPVLRERGFSGCTAFDCQGAGQRVTQLTFRGGSWRDASPGSRELMFAAFQVMRSLHEILWYLDDAMGRVEDRDLDLRLATAYHQVDRVTRGSAQEVLAADLAALRTGVRGLLSQVSDAVRSAARPADLPPAQLRGIGPGADLAGARLSGRDLRGADLRGAALIAADLHASDLRGADLLGADLRNADLSDADLSGALFLTRSQVGSARGNQRTVLPPSLGRPVHWAA